MSGPAIATAKWGRVARRGAASLSVPGEAGGPSAVVAAGHRADRRAGSGGPEALVAGGTSLGAKGHQRADLVAIHPGPAVAGTLVGLKAVVAHQAVQGVPADAELPGYVAQGRCVHRNRSLPRRTIANRGYPWQTVAK